MKAIPITEADLTSENDFRFAEAVVLFKSGDPQGCIINGYCALDSECFNCVDPLDGKTTEQLLNMIHERDATISEILRMHKKLIAEVHRNTVDLEGRYLRGKSKQDKSLFIICSIEQMFKRTYNNANKTMTDFFETGIKGIK